MVRPLRIEYAGALYYLSAAGNRGENVFRDSADASDWIEVLGNVCGRFGWKCVCYCLMSDRYHLVAETPRPNLSRAMRQLNGVYTQRSNRRHGIDGHVFSGRYRSVLVQKEKYLLPLVAHVLSIPLRAGFVKHPRQFKWSSCKYLYGKDEVPEYMDLGWFSDGFSSDPEKFDAFLAENSSRDVPAETKKQIYLGDESFIESAQKKIGNRSAADVPKTQLTKPVAAVIEGFRKNGDSRTQAIAKTYLTGDYTLKEISDTVGIHYSKISKIAREYEKSAAARPKS